MGNSEKSNSHGKYRWKCYQEYCQGIQIESGSSSFCQPTMSNTYHESWMIKRILTFVFVATLKMSLGIVFFF